MRGMERTLCACLYLVSMTQAAKYRSAHPSDCNWWAPWALPPNFFLPLRLYWSTHEKMDFSVPELFISEGFIHDESSGLLGFGGTPFIKIDWTIVPIASSMPQAGTITSNVSFFVRIIPINHKPESHFSCTTRTPSCTLPSAICERQAWGYGGWIRCAHPIPWQTGATNRSMWSCPGEGCLRNDNQSHGGQGIFVYDYEAAAKAGEGGGCMVSVDRSIVGV